MEPVEDIVIVGAGIAGLATALGLHRKGIKSLVLESSPTLRSSGFALGMWTNAWCALDALGIGDKVREHHLSVERLVVLSPSSGATLREMRLEGIEGKVGKLEIRCVRREFLLETLAKELPENTIRYSSKVVLIEEDGNLKLLHLADGSVIKAKVLIGGDGINSVVARYLGLKKPSFSGRSGVRGLAEYPTNHGFKQEFIQINGPGFRAGIIPCTAKSIYWFFAWHSSLKGSEKAGESAETMRGFITKTLSSYNMPKEIIQVINRSNLSSVLSTPLKYRSPFSLLFTNISKGNTCIIGDAFHPMTPDLGQGGCLALEDGVVLARCLSDSVYDQEIKNIDEGLREFVRIRRLRCATVVAIAYFVGLVQQSGNLFVCFLRERVLAGIMGRVFLKVPDYDCRRL